MANLAIGDRIAKKSPSHETRPIQINDVFLPPTDTKTAGATAPTTSLTSTPPSSPPQKSPSTAVSAGGEMERIRQALKEDRLMRIHDTEKRRPDYLKRTKRTLSEADSSTLDHESKIRDHGLTIGIMESPNKGRRLKLFQETSEESFEESLMAGGYGRYVCKLPLHIFL